MVLSKKDWEKLYNQDLQDAFLRVANIIDSNLSSRKMTTDTSSLTIYTKYKDELIELIIKEYEKQGWNVKRNKYSDFRESWDYLQFS
jgi:hypothetical protein